MSKKTAFLTTIYPMKEEYLINFLDSLSKQTFKNFHLIVVNDGYSDFYKMKKIYSSLHIKELKFSNTPVKNRQHGLNFIINNGYDTVFFGDSDDYFSSNRLELVLNKLNNYDLVVNDISVFDNKGIYDRKYFSNRIENNTEITIDFIKDKNIFGMSNTALNVSSLDNIDYDSDLIALDWYMFTLALLKSGVAIFTNEAETFYRQHNNNTVGIGKLNKEIFYKGVEVKLKQYELLSKNHREFESYLNEMIVLDDIIKKSDFLDSNFLKDIRYPFWWEQIKLIEEYK